MEPNTVDAETIKRLASDRDSGYDRPLLLVARLTSTGYVLDARQLSHGGLRELQTIATGPLAESERTPRVRSRSRGRRRLYLGSR